MESIIKIVVVSASFSIFVGILCLLTVCYVFYKYDRFGFGGAVLTVFGGFLVTAILWSSVKFAINKDGSITTEWLGQFGASVAETNKQVKAMEMEIATLKEVVDKISSSSPGVQDQIAQIEKNSRPSESFLKNGEYTVLVFYKPFQAANAKIITDNLLSAGFQASRVETDLTEAKQQFEQGTAWIVWEKRAAGIIEETKAIIGEIPKPPKIEVREEPYDLRNGDLQILLF